MKMIKKINNIDLEFIIYMVLLIPSVWLCLRSANLWWEKTLNIISIIYLIILSTWALTSTFGWIYDSIKSIKTVRNSRSAWEFLTIFITIYFGMIASFVSIYTLIFKWAPESFQIIEMNNFHWLDVFFLSVFTITTGGYRQIIPVTIFTKLLTMFEFISGYLMILIWLGWNFNTNKSKKHN